MRAFLLACRARGGSPVPSLMVAKGYRKARASSRTVALLLLHSDKRLSRSEIDRSTVRICERDMAGWLLQVHSTNSTGKIKYRETWWPLRCLLALLIAGGRSTDNQNRLADAITKLFI